VLSLCTISVFADDLRVNNSGTTCITYGGQTWEPDSYSGGWYKYDINGNTVSARGGKHILSDEQAEKYGLSQSSSSSGSSGSSSSSSSAASTAGKSAKYSPVTFTVAKVNIKAGAKVKSATAYKKSSKVLISVNKNKAGFTSAQISQAKKLNNEKGWIALSPLDSGKRAGRAISLINDNTLPTAKRTSLSYNPPGWKNAKVSINGKSQWYNNRCHLIAFCLSGLNDEKKNLITGAVTMNTPTMSEIEVAVQKYVKSTDNAVLYEVTPIYKGSESVARGLQIRYISIDLGKKDTNKIEKNVYLYNINPGWITNYSTGNFSKAA
jgi:DNA-entry nuclease